MQECNKDVLSIWCWVFGFFNINVINKHWKYNNYTVRDATTDEQGYFKGATAKVIAPTGNQTEENDRFYVMALSNFTTEGYTTFCWYYNAYGKMDPLVTEVGFETGR